MKVKQLLIVLSALVLVTAGTFIFFYSKKRSPLEQLPVLAASREIKQMSVMYSFGNGDGDENNLRQPIDIAIDELGQSYVIDNGDGTIKIYDPNGKFVKSFGQTGGEEQKLAAPAALAVSGGLVLVTDPTVGRIQAFDKNGEFVKTLFTSPDDDKYSPVGIAAAGDGHVLFTDVAGHRVVELDQNGQKTASFGQPGSKEGQFAYPHDLVLDKNKRIYVADSNNGRVQVFDRQGKFLSVIDGTSGGKSRLALPRGLTIDAYNHLVVVDTLANQVRFFELTGESLFEYGELGSEDGEFSFPNGVAVDGKKVFVADRENKRVQVFSAGT
ncbi:6-bladed beta-propeller [Paenibacillus athensensis]|uniref:6-bladed beta-propeller n=1 Tax=Paenibacillus athensensis TaxID=1967502 RepID=A0A4Y8Q1X2_9BACL|nr:6-bladed beta-propeller [Paenibacillus athensensis]MCD1261045.1 6-bladed beta-propeller [Paenibacillus athensensis]